MSFFFFALWTFVLFGRPQDFFPMLAPLRPALTLGILSALALVLGGRVPFQALLRARETKLYLLLYAVMLAGIPFSFYPGQSLRFLLLSYLANMLFYAMALVHADSLKRLKQLFFTLSLSVLFYASLSLVTGQFLKGRFFAGKVYDPNDLAFFLVTLFPLGILFIVRRHGAIRKALALATVGLAIATVLLTASRGGLIGLASVLAVLLFAKAGNPLTRQSHKLVLVLIAVAAIGIQAGRINVERYATLGELRQDYNVTSEDGRLTIWRRGLELLVRHPLLGVGVDCFPQAIGEMREKQGGSPMWQVAHNAYLQIAAEAGLPALMLFLGLVAATYKNLARVRSAASSSPAEADLNTVAGALSIGFIACLTTAFFLSQGYSILFTLFFALGTSVLRLHQTLTAGEPAKAAWPPAPASAARPASDGGI